MAWAEPVGTDTAGKGRNSAPGGDSLVLLPGVACPELGIQGSVCHGPHVPAAPTDHAPSSLGDPRDAVVAESPDQVPGAPGPGREQVWAWGHLPHQGHTGLASVCFGTLTRSSQMPVVPKPHELV